MIEASDIIAYILRTFKEEGIPDPGMTKLTKLVYLFDIDSYKRNQSTVFEWVFLHYGPYSSGLVEVLDRDGYEVSEETTEDDRAFKRVSESEIGRKSELQSLSVRDKVRIRNIVKTWGDEKLNRLLDFVYYETEPMARAKRNEKLDFSVIPTEEKEVKITAIIPKKDIERIRKRISDRLKKRGLRSYVNRIPASGCFRFHPDFGRDDDL